MKILAINPGSTSTKIALYEDRNLIFKSSLEHSEEETAKYPNITSQFSMREEAIEAELAKEGIKKEELSAIVGRGGLLPPVKSGAYIVDDKLADVLKNKPVLEHASNLGGLIAKDMADKLSIPAYIYDSVAVDELQDIARLTGVKSVGRTSFSHALNMRAAAMRTAEKLGKPYSETNQIVAHLGGGISLSVHSGGRMIDIVSDDEGPFSAERSGRLPIKDFVMFAWDMDQKTVLQKLRNSAGFMSHLGTKSALEVEKKIAEGDEYAKLVFDAMGYQIAKAIGELATVVSGNVDAISITGGIAYSEAMVNNITQRVKFIAPVHVLPGENELESLAFGALRVLTGEEQVNEFVDTREK